MKKKFLAYVGGLFVLVTTVFALNGFSGTTTAATVDNTPDCDTVAIIKCGAFSKNALLDKYDQNNYGDVHKIFNTFGISRNDLANSKFVDGIVWRDGRVTVDGKVVATNAQTAGRWNNPKSDMQRIQGTSRAYKMSTRHFVTEGQTAMVRMVNGKFDFAVIKSCGNPVTATPKPPKTPPKETPKPIYACEDIDKAKISRTEYRFTATASAKNGAEVVRYKFNFGDGKTATTNNRSINHTYAEPGDYTVRVTAVIKVDGKLKDVTSANCVVRVTVDKPEVPQKVEVCNPETKQIITVDEAEADKYAPVDSELCKEKPEEETPEVIPTTGPAEIIGGGAGLSALTAAGYHWRASRRQLVNRLLGH